MLEWADFCRFTIGLHIEAFIVELGDSCQQLRHVGRRLATDFQYDVAGQHAGAIGGTILLDAANQYAVRTSERERIGGVARDRLRLDAEPAARDFAVLDDLRQHGFGQRHRYREANAHRAARL